MLYCPTWRKSTAFIIVNLWEVFHGLDGSNLDVHRGPLIGDLCSKGTRLRLEFLKGDITAVIWMSLGFRSAHRKMPVNETMSRFSQLWQSHQLFSSLSDHKLHNLYFLTRAHSHTHPGLAFLLVGHLRQTKRLYKSKQMSIINVTFKMSVEIMHFFSVMQEICNFWKSWADIPLEVRGQVFNCIFDDRWSFSYANSHISHYEVRDWLEMWREAKVDIKSNRRTEKTINLKALMMKSSGR